LTITTQFTIRTGTEQDTPMYQTRQSPYPDLLINAFCIVTNSAHETPLYPRHVLKR